MGRAEQLITENLDLWSSSIKTKSSTGRGTNKKLELYGISKLRELILDLAVRGLLTPQKLTDDPAQSLLKNIANKKQELILSKACKKPANLPSISEKEKAFLLPSGWEWARLQDICEYTERERASLFKQRFSTSYFPKVCSMERI